MFGFLAAMSLVGIAIGPAFGGVFIRHTGSLLSIFYVTASTHFVLAILVWLLIPESLNPQKMAESRKKWVEASSLSSSPALDASTNVTRQNGWAILLKWAKTPFAFLRPLKIFMPMQREGKKGRDWSLTYIVLAQGCALSIMVRSGLSFLLCPFSID